jgi:hypothetical protein
MNGRYGYIQLYMWKYIFTENNHKALLEEFVMT